MEGVEAETKWWKHNDGRWEHTFRLPPLMRMNILETGDCGDTDGEVLSCSQIV